MKTEVVAVPESEAVLLTDGGTTIQKEWAAVVDDEIIIGPGTKLEVLEELWYEGLSKDDCDLIALPGNNSGWMKI